MSVANPIPVEHEIPAEQITDAIAATVPAYAGITTAALAADRDGILTAHAPQRSLTRVGALAPAAAGYDYRLIVSRELYDNGISNQASPSLAGLPRGMCVHLHPTDMEKLGLGTGGKVKVTSTRASRGLDAVADPTVARWTAWMPFNQPGGAASDFLDSSAPVNDVRIENV